jgi:pyruvyltransferase
MRLEATFPGVLGYSSAPRRRARALRRLAAATARPSLYPRSPVVLGYWWDGHPNFGDGLTPWLLPRYGTVPVHRVPGRAEMVGVGSILEHLPATFDGVVWGSGLMHDRMVSLPRARFLAVRGVLTRERTGAPRGTVLGDPGLLVSRVARRPAARWALGLVPHGHHRTNRAFLDLAERHPDEVRLVNVHAEPGPTVREIASCAAIVTSSLHGLVVADAFGIPAAWTTLEPAIPGGDFKFHDYETVVTPGRSRHCPLRPGQSLSEVIARAATADEDAVAAATDALESSAARLREHFAHLSRPPLTALTRIWGSGTSASVLDQQPDRSGRHPA